MTRTRVGAILVMGCLCAAAPGVAQNREGFWMGVGGGWGSAGVTADQSVDEGRENSGVGYLRGGWALTNRLLLGGDLAVWTKTAAIERDTMMDLNIYHFSGTLTYYPSTSGFFVKGGAGGAFMDAAVKVPGATTNLDLGKGFNVVVGAGFDIPIATHLAVTPAIDYWRGMLGDVKVAGFPGPVLSGWSHNVVAATVGITFY